MSNPIQENEKSTELSLEDQVIYGSLTTLAREVGHRLKRAAYSSLIRESDDYGAAIVSKDFELLAEAETTPLQMGHWPVIAAGWWRHSPPQAKA